MHDRNGQAAYAGGEFLLQDGAVHIEAVGIGAVHDHDFLSGRRAGVHQVVHGDVVGIVAQAHVLDVDHQHIKEVQFSCRRLLRPVPVEGYDGDPGLFVHGVIDAGAGIGRSPKAVLRAEYRRHIDALPDQDIQDMVTVCDVRPVRVFPKGDQVCPVLLQAILFR